MIDRTSKEWEGESRKAWAKKMKLVKRTLDWRINKHGWERAIQMGGPTPPGGYKYSYAKKYTHDGFTGNLVEWSERVGMSKSGFSTRVYKFGFAAAVRMPVSKPITNHAAKALLQKIDGLVTQFTTYRGGGGNYKQELIPIITEGESTSRPINRKHLGIKEMLGYTEEQPFPTKTPPSQAQSYPTTILQGIKRGAIKCAETWKKVLLDLCEICTVSECGLKQF